MNNIRETRNKLQDGKYNVTLELSDRDYFEAYESLSKKSGEDLLRNYLISRADDGSFKDIKMNYNKSRNSVKVTTELSYDNNEHSDYKNRGRLM